METGQLIAEERQRLGLSQGQLAEFTGMSREQINRLERGRREVTGPEVVRLALILGFTPDELAGRSDVIQFRGTADSAEAQRALSAFEDFVRNWQTIDTLRALDES
ncbi:MAG: helix-turn-helix domain-containing protein [Gemmatimonadales bacterium]